MSVVPFPPRGDGAGLDALIAEAKGALEAAADSPAMRREPYSLVMVALSSTLDVFGAGIERIERGERPVDAELRRDIIAVHEREARAQRLEAALLGTSYTRRVAVQSGVVVALLVLAVGGAALALGHAWGSRTAFSDVCQGEAVKEQGGGISCAFWLRIPNGQGPRKG